MTTQSDGLAEVARKYPRYAFEAYEFVFDALRHTQKMLGRRQPKAGAEAAEAAESQQDVSALELLQGIRELALHEFGLMARTVFRMWGAQKTDDFGEIFFNLVESGVIETREDSRDDFRAVYDFDQALVKDYRIQLDES